MSLDESRHSAIGGASATTMSSKITTNNDSHPLSSFSSESLGESLSDLGRLTESLLRTMRLDAVLLGSREEEMRSELVQLESQSMMLEQLLVEEEQKRMRPSLADTLSTAETATEGTDDDSQTRRQKGSNLPRCSSTINWEDDAGNKVDAEATPIVTDRSKFKEKTTTGSKYPELMSSKLKHSNFDWGLEGKDGDGIQEAARRASLEASVMGNTLLNFFTGNGVDIEQDKSQQTQHQKQQDSLQGSWPLSRYKNRPKENNIEGGNSDASITTAATDLASKRKNNQGKRRGWWARSSREIDKDNDQCRDSVASVDKTNNKNESRWNIFGGGSGIGKNNKKSTDIALGSTTEGSLSDDNTLPRFQLFRGLNKRPLNDENHNAASIDEEKNVLRGNKCNRSSDTFTNTRATSVETRQSPLNASGTPSSPQLNTNNNHKSNNTLSTTAAESKHECSSLQIKLRGCDLAASTLQQLFSFQTRNLYDLQHQRNCLLHSSKFEAQHSRQEIEQLQDALHFAKIEEKRKSRYLEDAQKKMERGIDQEGVLMEELESIHTELLLLHVQRDSRGEGEGIDNCGEYCSDYLVVEDSLDCSVSSHHQVVIADGERIVGR